MVKQGLRVLSKSDRQDQYDINTFRRKTYYSHVSIIESINHLIDHASRNTKDLNIKILKPNAKVHRHRQQDHLQQKNLSGVSVLHSYLDAIESAIFFDIDQDDAQQKNTTTSIEMALSATTSKTMFKLNIEYEITRKGERTQQSMQLTKEKVNFKGTQMRERNFDQDQDDSQENETLLEEFHKSVTHKARRRNGQ